jgi:hypothetical protein
MVDYVIWGWACVFAPDGDEVRDRTAFRLLSGYLVDQYATDHLGGTEAKDALAVALERSGQLRFVYEEGEERMRAVSAYRAKRRLSEAELALLVGDTLGQWSDGMGECVFIRTGPLEEHKLQPITEVQFNRVDYPYVEIRAVEPEPGAASSPAT